MASFTQKIVPRRIVELLWQGVTPEKLALSLALGVAIGVFPVLGTTTLLCALAAFGLRLNLPAIQIVNYFVYPAQIALLLPFCRLGEWIFNAPRMPLSVAQILKMVQLSYWGAMRFLWASMWHAVAAWCLLAPLGVTVMYGIFLLLMRRMPRLRSSTDDTSVQGL